MAKTVADMQAREHAYSGRCLGMFPHRFDARRKEHVILYFEGKERVQMDTKTEINDIINKRCKDEVTGFEGTCTACARYLTGNDRVLIEGIDTTGRPIEEWFDIDRVLVSE